MPLAGAVALVVVAVAAPFHVSGAFIPAHGVVSVGVGALLILIPTYDLKLFASVQTVNRKILRFAVVNPFDTRGFNHCGHCFFA